MTTQERFCLTCMALKAKVENKSKEDDTDTITQLKEELRKQNEQLINASVGLEHFFREMVRMG